MSQKVWLGLPVLLKFANLFKISGKKWQLYSPYILDLFERLSN
jgi:hypothetical protein